MFFSTKIEVGVDGRNAYERNKGKKATTLGIGIGEAVLWSTWEVDVAVGGWHIPGESWASRAN